jgi:hypothetical protein
VPPANDGCDPASASMQFAVVNALADRPDEWCIPKELVDRRTKFSGFLISCAMPAVKWPSDANFSVAICECVRVAQTVCVLLSALDRMRLEAIATYRNQPRKHVGRAHVVLASPDVGPCSRRRQRSMSAARWSGAAAFAEDGPEGLLRD